MKKKTGKVILYILLIMLLAGGLIGFKAWQVVFDSNVKLGEKKYVYVYIRTGTTYDSLLEQLGKEGVVNNTLTFDWVARAMKFDHAVKPGKYRVENGFNNRQLVNMLRAGNQEQVNLVIRATGTLQSVASLIGRKLEADSNRITELLTTDSSITASGFTRETMMAMFIPNTYSFYWNTPADKVFERLRNEYNKYWNAERKQLAASIGMSPTEVSTLASIVEKETQNKEEMPVVAGVYVNRLKRGQILQADPTVIFAANDPTIQRVTHQLTLLESPYNTYKYAGLPPGPICIPSVAAIESVLNYSRHKYIYFCAKEDFSGTHNFAETIEQHLVNARKYQQELNKRKIFH